MPITRNQAAYAWQNGAFLERRLTRSSTRKLRQTAKHTLITPQITASASRVNKMARVNVKRKSQDHETSLSSGKCQDADADCPRAEGVVSCQMRAEDELRTIDDIEHVHAIQETGQGQESEVSPNNASATIAAIEDSDVESGLPLDDEGWELIAALRERHCQDCPQQEILGKFKDRWLSPSDFWPNEIARAPEVRDELEEKLRGASVPFTGDTSQEAGCHADLIDQVLDVSERRTVDGEEQYRIVWKPQWVAKATADCDEEWLRDSLEENRIGSP